MILLIDMTYRMDSLSTMEYVYPLEYIVEDAGFQTRICHRTELDEESINDAERIIMCGTALMDNDFRKDTERFRWLREIRKPVLGICAGMQMIGEVFGGAIIHETAIGMRKVTIEADNRIFGGRNAFTAYEMHSSTVETPNHFSVVAVSEGRPVVIRHNKKEIYGALFHPEVRNDWFVKNFLWL